MEALVGQSIQELIIGPGLSGRGCAACQAHTPLQQFVRCLLDHELLDHGDVVVMITTKATITAKTTIT